MERDHKAASGRPIRGLCGHAYFTANDRSRVTFRPAHAGAKAHEHEKDSGDPVAPDEGPDGRSAEVRLQRRDRFVDRGPEFVGGCPAGGVERPTAIANQRACAGHASHVDGFVSEKALG